MGRSTKLANRSCWRRGHNYWFLKNHLEIWIIWTLARPRCRNNWADLVGQGFWRYSSLCFLCCPYRASVPSKGSSSSTLYTFGMELYKPFRKELRYYGSLEHTQVRSIRASSGVHTFGINRTSVQQERNWNAILRHKQRKLYYFEAVYNPWHI